MPESAPAAKIEATRGYGAEVVLPRERVPGGDGARADADRRPRNAVRPRVRRSGRGRRAGERGLEVLDQVPDVDTVLVPVGGGGLAGGVATAIKARSPETRVIGVQTEGASTLSESLAAGELVTREAGHHRGRDRDRRAERAHLRPVERAPRRRGRRERRRRGRRDSAPLGARETDDRGRGRDRGGHPLNDDALDELDLAGETVVPLLCGGNIDVTTLKEVVTHALVERDQLIELAVRIDDTPGTMGEISTLIGAERANIRTVRHERSRPDLPVGDADLVFEVETNGPAHVDRVLKAVREAGYEVEWTTQEG